MTTGTQDITNAIEGAIDAAEQQPPASAEQPFSETEIRAEVESIDIGALAKDEDEAILLRYLRLRSRLIAEATHIADQTQALLRQLENRIKGIDYVFGASVEDIARRRLAGQKRKSLKTPFGTVGFRTSPGGLVVDDEKALINAATLAPDDSDLRKVYFLQPKVIKANVNEFFKSTGEVPAGCSLKDPHEKFYVN